ncbi:MAG: FAD-dependent oxidoreductase [Acidimicrobiales bacterium]|jgi:thioredoxin reductase (NADPH)
MPVLFAVATDETCRTALDVVLRRRFESDYSVVVSIDPADGLERLGRYRDSGEQVAIVVALFRMTGRDGIPFLIAAHHLHPSAQRVLMIGVGDVSAAHDLNQALTLNQVDFYFGVPWESPEEEVYPVLGEALRVWAREHQLRYNKAFIVDAPNAVRGAHLRGWLERNAVATTLLRADDPQGRELLAKHGVDVDRLPVAVLYDGTVLVDPREDELAEALGANTHPRQERYDAVIVGAGPAGLAAAVYAGSEGLRALVVEHESAGGQAGTSSKIRNYLGFPWGVHGGELAERASRQAGQLGAEFVVARAVTALRPEGADLLVTLSSGDDVIAATVVITGGVAYRRLGVPAVDALVGAGVFYGAAVSETRSMGGLEVFVLGGGNSAGQAAAHLANGGAHVTVLVRSASLATTMSDYLIREIDASPNISVRLETEVVGAGSDGQLDHLVLRNRTDGTTTTVAADGLFVFIGARPHTEWLQGVVSLDDHGFVLTGRDLIEADPRSWLLERSPYWLETSLAKVFAAGDIRHGSVKRVAAAVGEGSTAAMFVREQIARR